MIEFDASILLDQSSLKIRDKEDVYNTENAKEDTENDADSLASSKLFQ